MAKKESLYTVYRPVRISDKKIAVPGDIVKCTEVEAMCINTMQPMTLRLINDKKRLAQWT